MKRMTYVDKDGNQVDRSFEQKKPLLRFFLVINIIIPLVIIVLIIVTIINNNNCHSIYEAIKKASLNYATDQDELPEIEGESTTVNIGNLYSEQYLKSNDTSNTLCSGNVKITKFKDKNIYTLDVKNCNICSTNKKYKEWSALQTIYPSGKTIIDVVPYYNYYDRDISTTKWSKYFDNDELSDEISEYDIKLPLNMESLPEIPKDGNIITIENDITNFYRYKDRSWKWYDIEGNYSNFSSEKPSEYEKKDESTEKYTEWSEYSTDYPGDISYRIIDQTRGYKFYYVNDKNEKVYYNKGKPAAKTDVNTEKYDKMDNDSVTLYRYRDKQWRWYNGQKRKYSNYSSTQPSGYIFKDEGLEHLSNPTAWSEEKHTNETNAEFRLEEIKQMTRFRIKYEMISLLALKKPLEKEQFENKLGENLVDFSSREDKKLEVTYKFKYRKSWY